MFNILRKAIFSSYVTDILWYTLLSLFMSLQKIRHIDDEEKKNYFDKIGKLAIKNESYR